MVHQLEIRSPRTETRKKSEVRMSGDRCHRIPKYLIWAFGFLSDFGCRFSDFRPHSGSSKSHKAYLIFNNSGSVHASRRSAVSLRTLATNSGVIGEAV